MKCRIGEGYDVHKLVEDRSLILGGVKIPYEKGLLGHSDADVLLHSIMDALLGAFALGDIGKIFPDTDEKYKNISSVELLKETKKIIDNEILNGYIIGVKNFDISNIDATIICEKPKLRSYIDEMRKNISDILNIDVKKVSIKATTEEGLGFTGSGQGIAARAVVMVELMP